MDFGWWEQHGSHQDLHGRRRDAGMGRLTDRLPGTEQATDAPAHAARAAGVDLAPDESREAALNRLQTTVGNEGMAALVNGQAPGSVLDGIAPPAALPGSRPHPGVHPRRGASRGSGAI